jgi:hypothetical protein
MVLHQVTRVEQLHARGFPLLGLTEKLRGFLIAIIFVPIDALVLWLQVFMAVMEVFIVPQGIIPDLLQATKPLVGRARGTEQLMFALPVTLPVLLVQDILPIFVRHV